MQSENQNKKLIFFPKKRYDDCFHSITSSKTKTATIMPTNVKICRTAVTPTLFVGK